jgi:twitching motility two-component system response regulator PilG
VQPPPALRSEPAAPSVLVVDDSLAVRNYLRSQLEKRGFAVADAADAQQAIELATTQSFGAVLMDVLMPGTDGYEACRQLKGRLRGAAAVPVIMLTCKSSPFDRIRGKMAGCDAYLTKPVDPKDLSAVLTQQLGARAAART